MFASSEVPNVTKPKPRERPVSRSRITMDCTTSCMHQQNFHRTHDRDACGDGDRDQPWSWQCKGMHTARAQYQKQTTLSFNGVYLSMSCGSREKKERARPKHCHELRRPRCALAPQSIMQTTRQVQGAIPKQGQQSIKKKGSQFATESHRKRSTAD